MGDAKNVERIDNEDGSSLKVVGYEDHIVVHEKDAEGNSTGRVTDWFDNPDVHVHDYKNDTHTWEPGRQDDDSNNESSENNSDDSSDNGSDNNSGGCFITSAVCANFNKLDDCAELTMFRHFRDTYMQQTTEMQQEVKEYYIIAPKICNAIDSLGKHDALKEYARIWESSLNPAFTALSVNDEQEVYNIYKNMVLDLKEQYLNN